MPRTKAEILKISNEEKVRFLRLQFTDIMGILKNVEVPRSQFEKALDGNILFDGSSIEGFTRIEEADMLLAPDLSTFQIFPWTSESGRVGRLICDVRHPDGRSFVGCPRTTLLRALERAKAAGFSMVAGPEIEFFLFPRDERGKPMAESHDVGGYFDLTPVDRGEEARRGIVIALEQMGFEVEAAHHEVAPGQHEIDLRHAGAIEIADAISTFRFVVKRVALTHGLHATFMPKPVYGTSGSGLHVHQSLLDGKGGNAFHDSGAPGELSETALFYIGGLLRHARGMSAVTNPLVNSYKRLVPGFEAPTDVAWSRHNRSPMIRIPARRGEGTRCEVRLPDPSCNPYLALAVMLRAGLDGIENKIPAGEPVDENIFEMSHREKRRLRIDELPQSLEAALDHLEKDDVVQDALGRHIFDHLLEAKRAEWRESISRVHPWEIDQYLETY